MTPGGHATRAPRHPVFGGLHGVASRRSRPDRPARLDAWRVLGPGRRRHDAYTRPISPHDPNVVVESCDMTGAYITRDGGESWRMFNLGTVASAFAFDPKDAVGDLRRRLGALPQRRRRPDVARWSFRIPRATPSKHGWGDHAETIYTTEDPLVPERPGRRDPRHRRGRDPIPRGCSSRCSRGSPGRPGARSRRRTALLTSRDRGANVDTADRCSRRAGLRDLDRGQAGARRARARRRRSLRGAREHWRHLAPAGESGSTRAASAATRRRGRPIIYATDAARASDPRGLIGGIYVSTDCGAELARSRTTA